MTNHQFTTREAEEEFESLESDEELFKYLDELASHIGWVMIYFNSLEDIVSQCIREAMLHDPFQDERIDVFLSEMLYASKCRSLLQLYGQLIESADVEYTQQDLNELEKLLIECASRRNEYAHGDWISMKKYNYVRVRTQTRKRGVFHKYKKFDLAQAKEDISFIERTRGYLDDFNERITNQLWGRDSA
jgi:hypothetical protein